MHRIFRVSLCLLLAGSAGCSTLRKLLPARKLQPQNQKTEERPKEPERIGTITLVNEEERFVVVDTGSGQVPAEGSALKVFGDGRETAVLAVGDVRRRPFIVADIVRGEPRKGDLVFR